MSTSSGSPSLPAALRAGTRRAALALAVAGAAACSPIPPPPAGPAVDATPFAVTATVDTGVRHQVMQGFGGAIAFYVNFVARHPRRDEIYQALFVDLGIQMLRIGNWYQNVNDSGASGLDDTVAVVQGATAALGHPPLLEMSSWSPPAVLKSTGHVNDGGTLAPMVPGGDRYADFGRWWAEALAQHAAQGVVPDYISIQNEPDFMDSRWQTCRLDAREGDNAGYDKALLAVTAALAANGQSSRPRLLGPEIAGIAGNGLATYLGALEDGPGIDELDGIAHHLYSGAIGKSFNAAMASVAGMGVATHKPLFMTEFGPELPDMFETAWLINTAVTVENVSAYLYWPLTWAPPAAGDVPSGLITTENPNGMADWQSPSGYTINDTYYALRHFSKWIEPGWQRVGTSSTADVVGLSAFASPDGQRLTIVLLNADTAPHAVSVDTGAFPFAVSTVYRTSGGDERTADTGPLAGPVMLPARALATVTLGP